MISPHLSTWSSFGLMCASKLPCTHRAEYFNPFTANMTSDDVLRKSGSGMSVGHCMTSGFSSHFSCTPNWSQVFKTNTSGQQNFCESLFLEEMFMNGTNALAGKGLMYSCSDICALHVCMCFCHCFKQ